MSKTICAGFMALLWASQCEAAGFQSVQLKDGDGALIQLAIWYPSAATAAARDMGVFTQEVAM